MEFSSFWRFRLLTIFISIYLVNDGKCDCGSGMKECQYGGWSVWGSCNNSVQTTKRIRPICCPPAITNYDACLKHCNITTNLLQTSEERNCIAIFKKNNSKFGVVGKCPSGAEFCHFSPWLTWESCNLTSSGELKQTRQRNLCCEIKKDCLKTCNISISTYGSMYKEERRCIGEIAESTKSSTGMIVGICFGILILLLIAAAVTLVLLHRFKKISLFTRLRAILHKDDDTQTETQPELKADSS